MPWGRQLDWHRSCWRWQRQLGALLLRSRQGLGLQPASWVSQPFHASAQQLLACLYNLDLYACPVPSSTLCFAPALRWRLACHPLLAVLSRIADPLCTLTLCSMNVPFAQCSRAADGTLHVHRPDSSEGTRTTEPWSKHVAMQSHLHITTTLPQAKGLSCRQGRCKSSRSCRYTRDR